MLTILIPPTNHKPQWIDIRVDGRHMGRVWGEVDQVTMNKTVGQFMVSVKVDAMFNAFLWADQVQPKEE